MLKPGEKTQRVVTVLVAWGVVLAIFGVYEWSFVRTQREFLEREAFRTLSSVAGRLTANVEKAQKSFSTFLELSEVEKRTEKDDSRRRDVLDSYLRSYLDIKGKKNQDEAIEAAQKCASPDEKLLRQDLVLSSDRLVLSIYCYSSGTPNTDQSNRVDVLSYDITPNASTFSGSSGPDDDIFDDVLVADRTGRVLFQYSQTGPQNSQAGPPIASLRSLLAGDDQKNEATPKPGSSSPSANGQPSPQASIALQKLAQSGAVTDVTVADVNYKLFSQPVHLPLSSRSVAEGTADVLVCALVNTRRFDKESHAVPYSKVIWAGMIGVLLFSLSWPLFKLRYMSDTERFGLKDGWFLIFAIFLVSVSGTLMLLNLTYTVRARDAEDRTLKQLADQIKRNFDTEMVEALAQLQQLQPVATKGPPGYKGARGTAVLLPNYLASKDAQPTCYPFFEAAFWTSQAGQQVVRLDIRGSSTPAIDVSSLPFFQAVKKAGGLTPQPHPDSEAVSHCPIPTPDSQHQALQEFDNIFNSNHAYIDPLLSRTTDDFSVVLANARPETPGIEGLAMKPMSLVDPVLPPGYGFAVIDGDCKVLFHSQLFRNMRENFCQESKDSYELKPVLLSAVDIPMNISYLGQTERAYVTEISSTHFAAGPAFLIVFRQPGVQLTLNLAIILVCSILLVAYFAVLALIAFLHLALRRPLGMVYPPEFVWPQAREALSYLELFAANSVLLLAFWCLYKQLFEAPLLAMTVAVPAVTALLLMLRLSPGREKLSPIGAVLMVAGAVLFIAAIVWTPRGMLLWFRPGMPAFLAWGLLLLLMGAAAVLLSGRRPWRRTIRKTSKMRIMRLEKEPAWLRPMPHWFKRAWVWFGQKQPWRKVARQKNYGVAYTLMCASVIVAVAVVPCLGFFKYAYDSVMELSLKHDQLALSESLLARRDRIRAYYENVKLPKDKNLIADRCGEYLDRYDINGFTVDWDWTCAVEQFGNQPGDNRAEVSDWSEDLNDLIEKRIATATLNFPSNQLGAEMSKLGLASTEESSAWEHSWEEPLPWQFKLGWKPTSRMPKLQIVSAYPQWEGLKWWALLGLGLLLLILAAWILGLARNIFFIGVEPAPPFEELNWKAATDIKMNYLVIAHAKSEKSQWLKSVLAHGRSQWIDARSELKQMIENPAYKTPVDESGVLVLDHFDYNLWDSHYNDKRLELLENLVYESSDDFRLVVVSTVDPLYFLREGGPDVLSKDGADPRRLLDRWARALSRFKIGRPPEAMTKLFIKRLVRFIENHPEKHAGEFVVRVCAECNCTAMLRRIGIDLFSEFRPSKKNSHEEVVSTVLDRAVSYYHVLWTSLAFAERQVLYQLALDGWTNAKNTDTIQQLERKQLIYRGPMYRIMNESFRRFIESPEHEAEILEWQKQERASTWHAFRAVLVVAVVGVAVWMLYTQAALSQTVVGVIAGSATLLTAVGGLLGRFKSKASSGS